MIRKLLGTSAVGVFVALSPAWASAVGMTPDIPRGDITIELEPLCAGLTSPVFATHAGDDSDRLFIVDQVGLVWILDTDDGRCLDEPFLDIRDRVAPLGPGFDERGLLGIAFHPRFERNRRFFVRYSGPREGDEADPCFGTPRGCHESILSEFRAGRRSSNQARPGSERIIFRVDQPQFNHNAGALAFGDDGLLYFGLGDGGGRNDGLNEDPPLHGPIGNAQNIENVLGSILRIDVNRRPDPGLAYRIPRTNPFAGDRPGADEIFAYGFRNPYQMSFDHGRHRSREHRRGRERRGDDSRLFVADVGQGLYEEVNIVRRGGNYGWVTAEGFHCFDPVTTTVPPENCPGTGPNDEPLLNPVAEYGHGDGLAIVGGFVYRGRESDSLYGKYVFGDFSRGFFPGDGRLFWLDADGITTDIFEFRITQDNVPLAKYLFGFGEDEEGELYVLTSTNLVPEGDGGEVFRLVVLEPDDDRD